MVLLGIMGVALLGIAIFTWVRMQVQIALPARPVARMAAFATSNDKGNFGELLTAVILTQQGWRQVPSKLGGGGRGIDGLFVRHCIGRCWEVLITETKVNVSPYKPRQLETGWLIRMLDELYLTGTIDGDTAASLVRGLKRRSYRIRRECWRHVLQSGETVVQRANGKGRLATRPRKHDNAHLMESLTMMLTVFDRDGNYIRAIPSEN